MTPPPLALPARCTCGRFDPAGGWKPGDCHRCWRQANPGVPTPAPEPVRASAPPAGPRPGTPEWKRAVTAARESHARALAVVKTPCRHLGAVEARTCNIALHRCGLIDARVSLAGQCVDAARTCAGCDDYLPPAPPPPAPVAVTRIDPDRLAPGPMGARFNASLIRFEGRLLMAYRTGWAGAQIHVSELAEDLTPGRHVTLRRLRHARANHGREDPRLFEHHGKLHVSYIGVERMGRGGFRTNQLFARLGPGLAVEDTFAPEMPGRKGWEKNWAFFEHAGRLHAVYEVRPHRVVEVVSDLIVGVHRTDWRPGWAGGEMRGGAPPVRVGDRYYHWFHGRIGPWSHGVYTVGVYTFAAEPPFRPLAYTPEPLMRGDKVWRLAYQSADFPAAVFPCGAILERGRWRVSMGVQDHWSEVAEWDAAAVDSSLVKVS